MTLALCRMQTQAGSLSITHHAVECGELTSVKEVSSRTQAPPAFVTIWPLNPSYPPSHPQSARTSSTPTHSSPHSSTRVGRHTRLGCNSKNGHAIRHQAPPNTELTPSGFLLSKTCKPPNPRGTLCPEAVAAAANVPGSTLRYSPLQPNPQTPA